jgi:hypothetical protein
MDAARAHMSRLNESIDHEAVKSVARAAAPHVGRAILHAVPHGHLIAKGVGAIGKAAGKVAGGYAESLLEEEDKVDEGLLREMATRLSRALMALQIEGKRVVNLPPPTPDSPFEPDPLILDTMRQVVAERKEKRLKTARALMAVADVTGQKKKDGAGEAGDAGDAGGGGPDLGLLQSLAGAAGGGSLMGLAASLAASRMGGGGGGGGGAAAAAGLARVVGGGLDVGKLAGLLASSDKAVDPASVAALARVTVALENPKADDGIEGDGDEENEQAAHAMHQVSEEQIRAALVAAGQDPARAAIVHASLQAASKILAKSAHHDEP